VGDVQLGAIGEPRHAGDMGHERHARGKSVAALTDPPRHDRPQPVGANGESGVKQADRAVADAGRGAGHQAALV
jgi:hypothetical protein